jgi:hypothetical protein
MRLLLLCGVGPGNFCLVHVSLVPVLNVVGEQVTFIVLFSMRPGMFVL